MSCEGLERVKVVQRRLLRVRLVKTLSSTNKSSGNPASALKVACVVSDSSVAQSCARWPLVKP